MSSSHADVARSLRLAIFGSLLTPTGLFCCLVALLIAVCPGARGDGDQAGSAWLSDAAITPASRVQIAGGSHAWGDAVVDVGPAASMAAFERPLAGQRGSMVKFARPAAPDERGSPASRDADVLGHSKAALPLLVDPLLTTAAAAPRPTPRPLTGPAVGVAPRPRMGLAPAAPAVPVKHGPFSSLRGSSSR